MKPFHYWLLLMCAPVILLSFLARAVAEAALIGWRLHEWLTSDEEGGAQG